MIHEPLSGYSGYHLNTKIRGRTVRARNGRAHGGGDSAKAGNAYQRFSRARDDVRSLLRAIISRDDLYSADLPQRRRWLVLMDVKRLAERLAQPGLDNAARTELQLQLVGLPGGGDQEPEGE